MAENVVEILVKSRNDTKAGFDSAKADAEIAGDEAGQGFMSKFGSWLRGGGGGSGGGGGGGVGGLLSMAFDNPYVLAGVVSITGALTTELVGVASGFAATAAGAVAFGLLALPTFEKVKTAYTNISAAQTAYNTALAKEQISPSKTNATAVATALLNLKAAQQQAGPGILTFIDGIHQLGGEFKTLASAFQPTVLTLFNQALTVAQILLPKIAPQAQAFAGAFGGLLKQFGNFAASPQFQTWLEKFDKLIGPATTAIGQGVGKVAVALGQLFTVMSAKDVVHSLNIAFDFIAGAIKVLTWVVHQMMLEWDLASSHIAAFSRAAQRDLANWAQVADNMVHNVEVWFVNLPGNILKALSALGGILFRAGEDAIRGFMNGLKSVPIIGTVASIASGIVGTFKHILGIGSPSRVLMEIGKNTAEGFHLGLTQSQGGLGGTITSSGGGAAGGWVEARFTGSQGPVMDALMQQQKLWIRRHGGGGSASVQIALGQ